MWRGGRSIRVIALPALLMLAVGCMRQMVQPPSPLTAGINPVELVEPIGEATTDHAWEMNDFFALSEKLRTAMKPKKLPVKRSILVMSGGGAYGAYSAGVLVGWTQSGTRPQFDVVTGISTGALIAPFAFLGSNYDGQMREVYTTLKSADVFKIRHSVRVLFGEGIADNTPLAKKIEEIVTPQLMREIAVEHAKGRRLYVGTTDLESRRAVQWDLGEIATRGSQADLELFRKLLLASSAIPGFFPPVKIPVTVDGQPFTERHIDGGVTNALFFRPPYVHESLHNDPTQMSLYDSDLYILVAGKLYADPEKISPRVLAIAGNSVSTLIYSQTRGDLLKQYMVCMITGMNYHIAAIPPTFAAPTSSTTFEPEEMGRMFEEGFKQSQAGTAWRNTPPGLERGEGTMLRAGLQLKKVDLGARQLKPPPPTTLFPWLQEMMNSKDDRPRKRNGTRDQFASEPAIRRIETGTTPVIIPVEGR